MKIEFDPETQVVAPLTPESKQLEMAAFNLCSEFGVEFVQANEAFARAVYRELLLAVPQPNIAGITLAPTDEQAAELKKALENKSGTLDHWNPEEYRIPCDVKLPPNTRFSRGCSLSTVIAGMEMRREGVAGIPVAQAQRFGNPEQPRPIAYVCPAGCGCMWRDNRNGTMSMYGPNSQSCDVCDPMILSELTPVFDRPVEQQEQTKPVACSERMPTAEDADPFGCVRSYNTSLKKWALLRWSTAGGADSHWLPTGLTMPQTPTEASGE